MKWLQWNDLTSAEKIQATESYICIREIEENRSRNEVNKDYPELIDASYVECCRFERMNDGYIYVDV